MELNKNRVSAPKRWHASALIPSRPIWFRGRGLLMGREQIGGCHLWSSQGGRGPPRFREGFLGGLQAALLLGLALACFPMLRSSLSLSLLIYTGHPGY